MITVRIALLKGVFILNDIYRKERRGEKNSEIGSLCSDDQNKSTYQNFNKTQMV